MKNKERLKPLVFSRLEFAYRMRGYVSLSGFQTHLEEKYGKIEIKKIDEKGKDRIEKKRDFSTAPSIKALYKYKRLGKIHPVYLDMICKELDVYPEYILGTYNEKKSDSSEVLFVQKLVFRNRLVSDQDGYIMPPYDWAKRSAKHKEQIKLLHSFLLSIASDNGLIIYSPNEEELGDWYTYSEDEIYKYLSSSDEFLLFLQSQITDYAAEHNFFGKEKAGEAYFGISE